MSFAEKSLYCIDCRQNFIFTVAEQEYHSSRGFPNDPGRCPTCRRTRKQANLSTEYSAKRTTQTDGYFR